MSERPLKLSGTDCTSQFCMSKLYIFKQIIVPVTLFSQLLASSEVGLVISETQDFYHLGAFPNK
jgi:hypothetical protein